MASFNKYLEDNSDLYIEAFLFYCWFGDTFINAI